MPNPYETKRYVDEYLLFHYGRPNDFCPFSFISPNLLRFHERIRKECLLPISAQGKRRALDIGCGVGRLSFELTRAADEVLGIDNSGAFIRSAQNLSRKRRVCICVHESGLNFAKKTIVLPKTFRAAKVRFEVGDAMNLHSWHRHRPYRIIA